LEADALPDADDDDGDSLLRKLESSTPPVSIRPASAQVWNKVSAATDSSELSTPPAFNESRSTRSDPAAHTTGANPAEPLSHGLVWLAWTLEP